MRNQIHRQKQAIAQKTIANLTQIPSPIPPTTDINTHKSICYIQITDFAETHPKDQGNYFRNTFFGKMVRRVAPKKDFFHSAIDKLRAQTEGNLERRTERDKQKEIGPVEYTERSSFIIQQLNNSHKMGNFKEEVRASRTEHRKGSQCRVKQTELVKDIEKLRQSENSYLQLMKRKSQESKCSEQLLQVPQLLHHHSDGESQSQDWRLTKEDILLELRQKIKNKQSRKHIYHALKSKNELWNKIRFKTHQNFHPKEKTDHYPQRQDHETLRLHCHLKQTAKSVNAINSKPANNKTLDNFNGLRIQSKPCTISLNAYPIPHLYSPLKQFLSPEGSPTASPSDSPSRNRQKRGFFDEIIHGAKTAKRVKEGGGREDGLGVNEFRLLTPWKNVDEEQV